ncbi:DUF6933 domain-containing protein [Litoribacillus peritrichatus]|uniref:DUF6933 domain-containing protein n=1 Tax=Litoribacillus peritrichatus TaxID=718191 RepID=A0ABP7MFX6_9GAMM
MLVHITNSLTSYLKEQLHNNQQEPHQLVSKSRMVGDAWQWHAHRFPYGDSCCVLLCHDATGFVLSITGLEPPDYHYMSDIIKDLLMAAIEDLGFSPVQSKKLILKLGAVMYDDQCLGSVKEMLSVAWQDLKNLLVDRPNLLLWNPITINQLINERIIKMDGEWCRPDGLFKTFVENELKGL